MTNNIPLNQRERKERLIKIGAIVVLATVAILVLAATGLLRKGYELAFTKLNPTQDQDPRAAVAEAGVSAYFNYDLNGDYDAWVKNICAISTNNTCMLIEQKYGPRMRKAVNDSQISSSVTNVKAIKMVSDHTSELTGHQEIWAVAYTLTNANGTLTTYDYVMITEVNGQWLFDFAVLVPQDVLDETYGAQLTPQATNQP